MINTLNPNNIQLANVPTKIVCIYINIYTDLLYSFRVHECSVSVFGRDRYHVFPPAPCATWPAHLPAPRINPSRAPQPETSSWSSDGAQSHRRPPDSSNGGVETDRLGSFLDKHSDFRMEIHEERGLPGQNQGIRRGNCVGISWDLDRPMRIWAKVWSETSNFRSKTQNFLNELHHKNGDLEFRDLKGLKQPQIAFILRKNLELTKLGGWNIPSIGFNMIEFTNMWLQNAEGFFPGTWSHAQYMRGAQREHHFTTFQMAYVCFQMVQVRWMLRVPHLPRHFHIFHFDWLSPLLLETHGWFHVDVIIYIYISIWNNFHVHWLNPTLLLIQSAFPLLSSSSNSLHDVACWNPHVWWLNPPLCCWKMGLSTASLVAGIPPFPPPKKSERHE